MAKLKDCVVIEDSVYCWDDLLQRVVEADLTIKKTFNRVPEEAVDAISAKRLVRKQRREKND